MRGAIFTVAAQKGGVGKTTLAFELAATLDGVLVDLDFHGGGATNQWGFDPTSVTRVPLLDGLSVDGKTPRPKRKPNRPDLVASHPDLSAAMFGCDDVADAIERWATEWAPRPVVIDTHPGAHWTTDGAIQVADVVITPVPVGQREIAATASMLDEYEEYPFLLVPNMVPATPPVRWIEQLQQLADRERVSLASPISEHRWLRRRMLSSAVTRQKNAGRRTTQAAEEFKLLARRAVEQCQQTQTA